MYPTCLPVHRYGPYCVCVLYFLVVRAPGLRTQIRSASGRAQLQSPLSFLFLPLTASSLRCQSPWRALQRGLDAFAFFFFSSPSRSLIFQNIAAFRSFYAAQFPP